MSVYVPLRSIGSALNLMAVAGFPGLPHLLTHDSVDYTIMSVMRDKKIISQRGIMI